MLGAPKFIFISWSCRYPKSHLKEANSQYSSCRCPRFPPYNLSWEVKEFSHSDQGQTSDSGRAALEKQGAMSIIKQNLKVHLQMQAPGALEVGSSLECHTVHHWSRWRWCNTTALPENKTNTSAGLWGAIKTESLPQNPGPLVRVCVDALQAAGPMSTPL